MPLFFIENKDVHLYLKSLNKYYESMPENLKKFCNQFLDEIDYNNFTISFSQKWPKNTDGRYSLFQELIRILLNTTMTWPHDNIPDMKVKDLPDDDKDMVIDYVGYLIGLPQGQGNDSLIRLYHKFKQSWDTL